MVGVAAVLATLACFAALPSVAGATRVGRAPFLGQDTIRIIDDSGDRAGGVPDRLEVTASIGTGVTVTSAVPTSISADPGCTQTNPFTVNCPSAPNLDVELAGGSDVLTDFTNLRGILRGGVGVDRLTGGPGSNSIIGGPDNDTLDGGDGTDDVRGELSTDTSNGVDTIRGGRGTDNLFANDGVRDNIIECEPTARANPGGDTAFIDLLDPEPTRCATVQRAAKDQHPTVQVRAGTVRVRRGRAAVRLRCPRRAPGGRCVGRVSIVKGRRAIARGRYRLRTGRSRTFRLRVGRRVRGRAEIRTSERDTRGMPETTKTTIVLRA